jgi:hypothetical protein
MNLRITEEQLKTIIKKESDVSEEVDVNPEPTAGTSSSQGGGEGYPEVGKWESGVTRGSANQVGNTKWSDIVGSSLKRGQANKLK